MRNSEQSVSPLIRGWYSSGGRTNANLGSHPFNLRQPPEFWDIAKSPARFIGVQCTQWQSCKTAGLCVGGDLVVNLVLLGKCCGDSGANTGAYRQL